MIQCDYSSCTESMQQSITDSKEEEAGEKTQQRQLCWLHQVPAYCNSAGMLGNSSFYNLSLIKS